MLRALDRPSAQEAVAALRARIDAFAGRGGLTDDLCMLAASIA